MNVLGTQADEKHGPGQGDVWCGGVVVCGCVVCCVARDAVSCSRVRHYVCDVYILTVCCD